MKTSERSTVASSPIDPAVVKLEKGFVSDTAQVNGTTLHYVRGGTGSAVILVHGFPQDWYEFHYIMPRLAKQFTVIAVDLRGIGGSAATPSGYDAAKRSALDVPIVLACGDLFGKLNPRIAKALRAHGCANVTTEVITNSVHYVVDEQPASVAKLIERYASL